MSVVNPALSSSPRPKRHYRGCAVETPGQRGFRFRDSCYSVVRLLSSAKSPETGRDHPHLQRHPKELHENLQDLHQPLVGLRRALQQDCQNA